MENELKMLEMMWSQIGNAAGQGNDPFMMFRLALSIVGFGLAIIGLVMFFFNPKDETKKSPYSARLTALITFVSIGIGTIAYAWLWFGK